MSHSEQYAQNEISCYRRVWLLIALSHYISKNLKFMYSIPQIYIKLTQSKWEKDRLSVWVIQNHMLKKLVSIDMQ